MNEKFATNTAVNAAVNGGSAVPHDGDSNIAAAMRLVELEALVGNLYLAKDVVSKSAYVEQADYTTHAMQNS